MSNFPAACFSTVVAFCLGAMFAAVNDGTLLVLAFLNLGMAALNAWAADRQFEARP